MASIPGRDLQQEFLALTRSSQQAMVNAIRTWMDTVRNVTPHYENRLTRLWPDRLRTPEEAIADACRLTEHLLQAQRKLAEDLLKAAVPLFRGAPRTPGAPPATADAPPATPDAPPATAGAPPATPGAPPATAGAPPATPGALPATPSALPATPGAPPATPGHPSGNADAS
jgi:hypothetical protein